MNAIQDDKSFIEALRQTPTGLAIAGEAARAEVQRRALIAKELDAEIAKAISAYPTWEKKIAQAAERRAKAAAALQAAEIELANLANGRDQASHAHSVRKSELEAALTATASPMILVFIGEMSDVLESMRKERGLYRTANLVVTNPQTNKKERRFATNQPSIKRRIRAIFDAMDSARALALIADQADVPIELERLRQGLPAVAEPEIE